MTSNEMVERVASAIADSQNVSSNEGVRTDVYFVVRDVHRRAAIAAIAAMRNPTLAMIKAADAVGIDQDPPLYWRAMIDAALLGEVESV